MIGEDAFVQVTEVWVPDGDRLKLHSGAYGHHTSFEEVSSKTVFSRGEGLPGAVWKSGRPQIWAELSTDFVRHRSATEAGLDAGVGLPVYNGVDLVAVVVLLCGSREQTGGCIEVWEVDPKLEELCHADAYYGRIERFSDVSRLLRFQKGRGLPGITWKTGMPQIVADTRRSTSFLRSSLARECGIGAGLGIPVFHADVITHVLLLLSAHRTPIARAFEIWTMSPDERLRLSQSAYADGLERFEHCSRDTTFGPNEGLPGRAFSTGRPLVFDNLATDAFVRAEEAQRAGLRVGVAIPVHDGRHVTAVIVLLS